MNEAIEEVWETDAHFATYFIPDAEGWPRCNKPVLPEIRKAGGDILTGLMVLDYDLPGHRAWHGEEEQDAFVARLAGVADSFPAAWSWSALYTTRGGARLVYVLDRPIRVDEAEGRHQWLCQQFHKHGIGMDLDVSDWTRVYRLPFVVRDGNPTYEEARYEQQWDNRLEVASLGTARRQKQSNYGEVKAIDRQAPTREDALALLRVSGKGASTDWFKEAKRRLKGRDCYPCLFEHAPIAHEGSRDSTIHAYVGQAVALLYNITSTTPEHVYALFLEAVEQLEPDEQTPDWVDVLWSSVCRLWAKQQAKEEERIEEEEVREKTALGTLQNVVEGMKEWNDSPDLRGDAAPLAAASRLVCSVAGTRTHFLIGRNGYYRTLPILESQIPASVRDAGMDDLIEVERRDLKTGEMKQVPVSTIKLRHETVVKKVLGKPDLPGGMITDIGTERAVLELPIYRVNRKLKPAYNPDVDQWLHHFFGTHYDEVENWLAWATDFSFPICALSVVGPPGIGKKLLTVGLSETLEEPAIATERDLVGRFQYGLLRTPFLNVNEGWPEAPGQEEPSAVFRRLVSGDPLLVEEKFRAPIEVVNPARVVLTANNLDVVRKLVSTRDPSPNDREAILTRILHVEVGRMAEEWLRDKGGLSYTGRPGQRWIRGDGGQRSDYIVARHLLWLAQNRKRPMLSNRLCVEGNGRTTLGAAMRTLSGAAPDVVEAIIKMVESRSRQVKGAVVIGDEIYATPAGVVDYLRNNHRSGQRDIRTASVAQCFRGLMIGEPPEGGSTLAGRPDLGKRRWYRLDAKLLLDVAMTEGRPCDVLLRCARVQEMEERRKAMEDGDGDEASE